MHDYNKFPQMRQLTLDGSLILGREVFYIAYPHKDAFSVFSAVTLFWYCLKSRAAFLPPVTNPYYCQSTNQRSDDRDSSLGTSGGISAF